MRQRRIDFENVFGPFSVWDLLPFKKLKDFWNLLVNSTVNTQVNPKQTTRFEKITQHIMKYVQGLYPL